jgi:hypothetical protein
MIALRLIPAPLPHAAVPALGYWFYALASITAVGPMASLAESLALSAVLFPLAVGSAFLGVFYTLGGSGWENVGGYITMASAFTAFYTASAMVLVSTCGRVILPWASTAARRMFPAASRPTRFSSSSASPASSRANSQDDPTGPQVPRRPVHADRRGLALILAGLQAADQAP